MNLDYLFLFIEYVALLIMTQKSFSLTEIYEHLKPFHLSDSLFVIGMINSAFKYGVDTIDNAAPKNILAFIRRDLTSENHRRAFFLMSTRLSRYLLLSGSNDFKSKILDFNPPDLQRALNMVGHLLEYDLKESKNDWERIFGRLGQWQFPLQLEPLTLIGRAHLLYNKIPKSINTLYNFENKMQEYFGISIYSFIASGISLWITSNGRYNSELKNGIDTLNNVVTDESVRIFTKLSTITPREYREAIRGTDWKKVQILKDMYAFDALNQKPIVKVEKSTILPKESYVIPQPSYLIHRVAMGVFYLLSDKEQELTRIKNSTRQEINEFRISFGSVYREYVKMNLKLSNKRVVFVDLDDQNFIYNKKKPDFAIIENETCVLIEVKTTLLNLNVRTYFDRSDAETEIKKGTFNNALKQLNDFESAILQMKVYDARFKNVRRVVKVIVGFEDIFLANSFILPILRAQDPTANANLQICTISDIEMIGTYLSSKHSLAKIFSKKISDSKSIDDSMSAYIKNNGKKMRTYNLLLRENQAELFELMLGKDNFNKKLKLKSNPIQFLKKLL